MLGLGMLGRVVADALDRRNEDHRRGAQARHHLGIVARTGCHRPGVIAEPLRLAGDAPGHTGVELHRGKTRQWASFDAHAFGSRQFADEGSQPLLGLLQQILVGVAQVHRELGARGDDVDQVRVQGQRAHGGDLAATHFVGQPAHEAGDGGRTVPGVMAQPHRRGAGVVGLAGDAQRLPRNALHVLHGPDQAAFGIQHRALLDMQFDKSLWPGQRQRGCAQVADALQFVGEHGAIDGARGVCIGQAQAAGVDQRPQHVGLKARAFFVGEHRHHQRMTGGDARRVERPHDRQAGEHAVVAVVAATGGHGVDV